MTGREKLLAAMSEQGTASTPIVLAYPEIFMRDHWEEVTDLAWWGMHSHDIPLALKAHADLLDATGEDRVRLWMSPPHEDRHRYRIEGIDGQTARRIDTRTGDEEILERPPKGGFLSSYNEGIAKGHDITSREQIDEALPIAEAETPETLAASGRDEKPKRMLDAFCDDKMPWTQISAPFDPLPFIWGYEGLMIALIESPDLVEYALGRSLRRSLRLLANWKAVGVELIWIEECMTDQMSPEMYRRVNLPYLRRLTAAIRAEGLVGIYYYTGNPMDRLELLLASGADALALEESKKNFTIDIEDLAARVDGRMPLVGNLDAGRLLEIGPVDAIRDEIARQLDAGRRNAGRFIMGIGSPITPGTPLEHVRAIARTVHDLAP
jgi:uroporphyrinogen decarboxylase-like protein